MKNEKIYSFVAWWDGRERRCSQIETYDSEAEIEKPGKGILHTYDNRKDAEDARNEELSKND